MMRNTIQNKVPLATFLLLTYNQEAFVREAVTGALAQTYSPLEIIISDDASTDRTFDILTEVVEGYQGPHVVSILRNEVNLGLIGHINKLVSIAEGELLILAAGDDFSFPERTHALVSLWEENRNVDAICSAFVKMDASGTEKGLGILESFVPTRKWLITKKTHWFGCSAAYSKRLFTSFGPIAYNTTEDVVCYRRALLLGGLCYVQQPLVKYRIGCGISTRKVAPREKAKRRNEWRCNLARQMLCDFAHVAETPFILRASAWWCRALESHLLFKSVLSQKGFSRLAAYGVYAWRYPSKALPKINWLFRS